MTLQHEDLYGKSREIFRRVVNKGQKSLPSLMIDHAVLKAVGKVDETRNEWNGQGDEIPMQLN
jgi:hypothetical protein